MTLEQFFNFGKDIFDKGFFNFALTALIVILLARFVLSLLKRTFNRLETIKGESSKTQFGYVYKTLKVVVYAAVAYLLCTEIIPLQGVGKAVIGASSIMAVVVALAAQETFGNFIAGFVLALYQPFHVGDLVTIVDKNITGYVRQVTFRHTIIRTFENTKVVVPNSIMNTAIIEDKEFTDTDYTGFLLFDISYDSDIDLAKEIIRRNCEAHPNILDHRSEEDKKNNAPIVPVLCVGLKEYSVSLRATCITSNVGSSFTTFSDLRQSIKKDFEKNGIVIPFPTYKIQQDK